jgi:hypothetical protein
LIRVTIRSPKRLRKAVYLCAAYFRREFHYDFVQYGFDGDEDDPDHVAFLWVPSGTGLHLLAPPARSCRHCNVAGFCAGALGGRAELRGLRVFWIVLPTAKTSISSILALLASLSLILLATITLFKLLLKNASRARRI